MGVEFTILKLMEEIKPVTVENISFFVELTRHFYHSLEFLDSVESGTKNKVKSYPKS